MENLVIEIGLDILEVDIDKVWEVVEELPDVKVLSSTYRSVDILKLRYNHDGNINLTYKVIAEKLGINVNKAAYIIGKILSMVRHPSRIRKVKVRRLSEV